MENSISKHNKRKILVSLVLILLTVVFLIPANDISTQALAVNENSEGLIRLHIRASDDSEEAQNKKLLARDAINAVLGPRLIECNNADEARQVLLQSMDEIISAAQNASGQSATAELTKEFFPDRVYGDTLYPAGEYEALIVKLDGGKGENWWCVAFPPLCYSGTKTAKNNSSGKVKIVYKSKIAEWIKRLFKS